MIERVETMSSIVLQAESLNLPEVFALKLRGKKVTLTESGNAILISPIEGPNVLADTLEEWEGLKKFKGIITHDIDEKTELNEARDEKYAHLN